MPRLNENERNRALGMVEAKVSIHRVARHFHCHPSTIGSFATCTRSGMATHTSTKSSDCRPVNAKDVPGLH